MSCFLVNWPPIINPLFQAFLIPVFSISHHFTLFCSVSFYFSQRPGCSVWSPYLFNAKENKEKELFFLGGGCCMIWCLLFMSLFCLLPVNCYFLLFILYVLCTFKVGCIKWWGSINTHSHKINHEEKEIQKHSPTRTHTHTFHKRINISQYLPDEKVVLKSVEKRKNTFVISMVMDITWMWWVTLRWGCERNE